MTTELTIQQSKAKGPAKTLSRRQKVYLRDKGICYLCGLSVPESEFTLDHVKAKIDGGKDKRSNLKTSHKACNMLKGRLSLDEYRKRFGGPPQSCE